MKKDDRRASPSKDSSQKEDRHNKDKGFEIKIANGFEVLQSQEVENISIEENLEEGEIEDTDESQHEALKETDMKNNKVFPEVFEGQEVTVGKKINFGSPQVILNSLFQNVGIESPTSSQKIGEPWTNKKPVDKDEEDEEIIVVGKKKNKKTGCSNGVKLEPDLR